MRHLRLTLALVSLLLASCGGTTGTPTISASAAASEAAPSTSAIASEAALSPLVGEWVGIHDCDRIVEALRTAGFDEAVVLEAVLGNGLVPDATSADDLADPADPCADAVPREHGHFFTASGAFGSTDYDGNQVDDGTYTIVDEDTVSINGTEFGYVVEGDTLTLEAIIPDGCLAFECQWSIMVAMPGQSLERAD